MLNIGALYELQATNGDLSGSIELQEDTSSELDKLREFIQDKVGYDAFNDFMRLQSEEDEAYRKNAYIQGFKDAMALMNDIKN